MSDKQTIAQYEKHSNEFITRYNSVTPGRLYELMATFFYQKKKTLDIGCASGRDLSYMKGSGFDVEGLDTVENFVKHCKEHLPNIPVFHDSLPLLGEIQDSKYDNILISAILMHLPTTEIIEAAANILRVANNGARIIISIRKYRGSDESTDADREEDGRLFTNIAPARLASLFSGLGAKLLFQEEQLEKKRTDVCWYNFVFEKVDSSKKDGIDQIQEILIKDSKVSSYKFALLRGLNYLARHENGIAKYDDHRDYVWIPLRRVAFTWIKYYFPLLKNERPFKQITSSPKLAIAELFTEALDTYKLSDLPLLINEYEQGLNSELINHILQKISKTIKDQPLHHTTNQDGTVFEFMPKEDAEKLFHNDFQAGAIGVPISIWHDLMLFGNWIDDGLYIQWAKFIKGAEQDRDFGEILNALTEPVYDKRSTYQIQKLFEGKSVECVWSGESLTKFDVDHTIPYSLWKNNDLWNLLPCKSSLNLNKTDKLPSLDLLKRRKDCIISYWELYQKSFTNQFDHQLIKSLGTDSSQKNWQNEAYLNLLETISRLSVHRIGDVWKY